MAKPLPAVVHEAFSRLQACLVDRGEIRSRAMFGGYGFYLDDLIFAIWADGLYLKVDAATKPRFAAEGLTPFRYSKANGTVATMSYYHVPEAWDTPEKLAPWAALAVAASQRSAKSRD